METQTQTTTKSSRILFSTYDGGDADFSWSVRWKGRGASSKPTVLCWSHKPNARITQPIMEEFFKDQRIEAILAEVMRRHGEP